MSLLDGYEAYKEPAFFECGALELARILLGKYLYCQQSGILVRIVETEVYPHGVDVYNKFFGTLTAIPNKAGEIVQLRAGLHYEDPEEPVKEPKGCTLGNNLYITAGGQESTRDLVLLRSCEPHVQGETPYLSRVIERLGWKMDAYSKKNLLIRPGAVAYALAGNWESNPVLYEEGRNQLFHEKDVHYGRLCLENEFCQRKVQVSLRHRNRDGL